MTRKVYGGSGIIALAATLRIASASAGPCAEEIAAQLEHQPTHESVEHAKKQAQAQILMVVTQAEALDSEGKKSECRNALAKAKLLLNP
jgi:hypothetical protein